MSFFKTAAYTTLAALLFHTPVALAQSDMVNSVTVPSECRFISASTLHFGDYDPLVRHAGIGGPTLGGESTINIRCSFVTVSVALGTGKYSPTGSTCDDRRRMRNTDGSASYINYRVGRPNLGSSYPWRAYVPGRCSFSEISPHTMFNARSESFTFRAIIMGDNSAARPGNYEDAIDVYINF